MSKSKEIATVVSNVMISEDVWDMKISTSKASYAKPGQFIGIYLRDSGHILPRPISICDVIDDTILRIVYRVVGCGTDEMSRYKVGEDIAIIGILGNGFDISRFANKKIMLIGGGIGIPPLIGALKEHKGSSIVVLGYRNIDLFLDKEFEQQSEVHIATDDGSVGYHGNVVEVIKDKNLIDGVEVILSCGPLGMIKGVKSLGEEYDIPTYISLEERMACGVGCCLGCIVKTTKVDEHSLVTNARICCEGPVFNAKDVEL